MRNIAIFTMPPHASKELISLILLLFAFCNMQGCLAQQDFSEAPIPNPFRNGNFYPPRSEVDVCRPIQNYISRGSARFNAQLVTNTNANINFATSDSRIMSSRLQSRLNSLVRLYNFNTNGQRNSNPTLTVLKAWTPFPDNQVDALSLHYEGEFCPLSFLCIFS